MTVLIIIAQPEYRQYAEELSERYNDIIIIARPPAYQPFDNFIKEHAEEVGADTILVVRERHFKERMYELRFRENIQHAEHVWFVN
jgi:hypothetical protein